jgi:hypothetical protein
MTLGITAPELYKSNGPQSVEDVAFFDKNPVRLPTSVVVGDVIMMRNLKRTGEGRYTCAKAQFQTETTIFSASTMPNYAFVDAYMASTYTVPHCFHPANMTFAKPRDQDSCYAIYLSDWATKVKLFGTTGGPGTTAPVITSTSAGAKRGLVKLSSLRRDNFYEVVAEITRLWVEYGRTTIYITDYTENPFFYDQTSADQGPQPDWLQPTAGPVAGKMVLQVTLFSPNAEWAVQHEQELLGAIVHIRNLNIQINKRADNIEGKLHGDRYRPNQIDIQLLGKNDARVKDLIEARDTFRNQTEQKPLELHDNDVGEELTRKQKKNAKKKQKQVQKEEREALELKEKQRSQAKKPTPFEAAQGPNSNSKSRIVPYLTTI